MFRFCFCVYACGLLGAHLVKTAVGLLSSRWIAVQFPEGPRYDLGLIDVLFLIALAVVFRVIDRYPCQAGFFCGLFGVICGGFRIWLDTLHIQPMRLYGGAGAVIVGILGWMGYGFRE
jgi:hypothetical protein